MKREDFKKIIKLRSFWKIDKRKGNYKLPNGDLLSAYIEKLVRSQLDVDSLGIMENGDLCAACTIRRLPDNIVLMPAFRYNEIITVNQHEKRIEELVFELVG